MRRKTGSDRERETERERDLRFSSLSLSLYFLTITNSFLFIRDRADNSRLLGAVYLALRGSTVAKHRQTSVNLAQIEATLALLGVLLQAREMASLSPSGKCCPNFLFLIRAVSRGTPPTRMGERWSCVPITNRGTLADREVRLVQREGLLI